MARHELKVDEWFTEIDRGLDFRREYGIEDSWAESEGFFYNVHSSQDVAGPNLIYSTGDALLSTLATPYPYITIKPRRIDYTGNTPALEALDNMLVDLLGVPSEVETAMLHAYLYGKGILKIGYDSEFGYDPAYNLREGLDATLTQFDRKGRRIEFGGAEPGMPWVQAVLPHDIIVPYGTRRMESAEWVVHRVVRQIEDIRADTKYENHRDLQPNMSMRDFVKSYTSSMKPFRGVRKLPDYGRVSGIIDDGGGEFVELWEIHDTRTGRLYVVASGHKRFLRNDIDLTQLDGLPFVDIGFVPRARTFWVTPDAHYLRHSQAESNDISLQQRKQRRIAVLRFLYEEDSFGPEELEKLLLADVGAGVMVKGGHDIQKAVTTLQPPAHDFGLQAQSDVIRRNAREVVGFSRNQFGEFESSGRRTATEAGLVAEGSSLRMSRRQIEVLKLYRQLMRKINGFVFEFWKTPRIIQAVGQDGSEEWVDFTGSGLRGEYLYGVEFSSEPPETRVSRRQLASQIYQAFAADPTIDPAQLRKFLTNAFASAEVTRALSGVQGRNQNAGLSTQVPGLLSGGARGGQDQGQGQASQLSAVSA